MSVPSRRFSSAGIGVGSGTLFAMTSPLQTVSAPRAARRDAKDRQQRDRGEEQEALAHGEVYLAAYSDGSDCKPSTQSTVTLSSFDSNMEIVAFGLTAGSTRALMICVR